MLDETGIVTYWRAVDAVLTRWRYPGAKAAELYRWMKFRPEMAAAAIVRSRRLRAICGG